MNRLLQLENNLIGDNDSYKALQEKEEAKILLISDSHGARNTLKSILLKMGKACDCLIFCGDGSYDLSSILDEADKNPELKEILPPVIAMARGNGDATHCLVSFCPNPEQTKNEDEDFYKINIPVDIILTVAGRKILATHGHKQGVYFGTQGLESAASLEGASAAFFGHSHIPFETQQNAYLANPGSINSPRGRSPKSFAVVEVSQKHIGTTFYRIEETSSETVFSPYFPGVYSLF